MKNAVYQRDIGAKHYQDYTSPYNFGARVIIGKYGTMAMEHMKETAPVAYEAYSKFDEFKYVLAKINDEAAKLFRDIKTMLKKQYPTPKTDDFAKLLEHNTWIEDMAEEAVCKDVVFVQHISDAEVTGAQNAKHGRIFS